MKASESTTDLKSFLSEALEIIDPDHRRPGWPDPIAWDSRPLQEQAEDIAALLTEYAKALYERGRHAMASRVLVFAGRIKAMANINE